MVAGAGPLSRGRAAAWLVVELRRWAEVEAAEARVVDGASARTRGSTVSPTTPRSVRTWGHGRRKLMLPTAAPFLLSVVSVFTKCNYRTTKSVYLAI